VICCGAEFLITFFRSRTPPIVKNRIGTTKNKKEPPQTISAFCLGLCHFSFKKLKGFKKMIAKSIPAINGIIYGCKITAVKRKNRIIIDLFI
jgi:hypothetical protein